MRLSHQLSTYPIQGSIYRTNKYDKSVYTPTGCKKQEVGKVGMVHVTNAGVNPWTVVVHLHHTPATVRGHKIKNCMCVNVLDGKQNSHLYC